MKKFLLSLSITVISFLLSIFSDHLRAQTIIYSQNFECDSLPSGWTQQTLASDGGWQFGNASQMSSDVSNDFAIPAHTIFACTNSDKCECNKSNDMLITQAFNFDTLTGKNIQLSFDEYYYGVGYSASHEESAYVKASTDGGTTWVDVASIIPIGAWFNQVVDLSSYAGQSSVMLAFVYDDDNGGTTYPLFGCAIDNVLISIPVNYNVSCFELAKPQSLCFRNTSPDTVAIWYYNRCSSTINSITLNYQDNSGNIVTETQSDLNITPGNYNYYIFNTLWNPTVGEHTLNVWASEINGNPNQNHMLDTTEIGENDTLSQSKNVYKSGKPVLVEYFTQVSCGPCAEADPYLQNTVAQDEDFVMAIAYHYSFETPADPMSNTGNSSDITDRVNFYGVGGTPYAYTDGTMDQNLLWEGSECDMGDATGKDTVFEINNPTAQVKNDTISYSADFVAEKTISGSIKGYVAVIEQEIDFTTAPGSNGQTKFPWVMRKMCPNGNGTAFPSSMNAGDIKTISGSWKLYDIYKQSELRVIFFVQNTSTKEVYWAAMVEPIITGIKENHNLSIEKIYPNPTKDEANIYFSLTKPEDVGLSLYNMLGKKIRNYELGIRNRGENIFTLDVNSLNAGMYFIELKTGTEQTVSKINVIK